MVNHKDVYRKLRRKYLEFYLEEVRRIRDEVNDVRRTMFSLGISSIFILITKTIKFSLLIFCSLVTLIVFGVSLIVWYRRLLRRYRRLVLMDLDEFGLWWILFIMIICAILYWLI